ncbi:uncharacterized protein LOC122262947 [Penaeus japonicus]|uniref:uncharacterized protein LOC122262947 n=1 Tax=Penaeus japonicus TaxID=27405 RepID=UPI001C71760E|nr:uncharacterized protein LOC122262947 [Penaeus japonicus]
MHQEYDEQDASRLSKAPLSIDGKHPFILPGKHHVTEIIIKDCNERVGHQGREHVLSSLRERYWILKGNSAIRRVIKGFINCHKCQAPDVQQQMADLPENRVSPNQSPFTTAVECFGPFHTTRTRFQVKPYGVIFICLTVRAVHVQVAESLFTDSFTNALRRFIARRGQEEDDLEDHAATAINLTNPITTVMAFPLSLGTHRLLMRQMRTGVDAASDPHQERRVLAHMNQKEYDGGKIER